MINERSTASQVREALEATSWTACRRILRELYAGLGSDGTPTVRPRPVTLGPEDVSGELGDDELEVPVSWDDEAPSDEDVPPKVPWRGL